LALERGHACARQLIGTLIVVMAGMALDPMPAYLMALQSEIEALPQIGILHWLLLGRFPAVALPAMDPLADAVPQILPVGWQFDGGRPGQRFERHDRGGQLHAVVGGERFTARQLLLMPAIAQDGPPAARTRIARAGAVGVNDHRLACHAAGFASRN